MPECAVYTVEEIGRILGISRATAYEVVARKEIRHVQIGRRKMIPKIEIEKLLNGEEKNGKAQ